MIMENCPTIIRYESAWNAYSEPVTICITIYYDQCTELSDVFLL